jgi:phosphate-selective porin OprO/OprP
MPTSKNPTKVFLTFLAGGLLSLPQISFGQELPLPTSTREPKAETQPPVQETPSNSDLLQRLDQLEKQLQQIQQEPTGSPDVLAPVEPAKEKSSAKPPSEDKVFQVGKLLKMEGSWKNGLWFETADKAFRWNVGGVIQYDMGWYGADQKIVDSIGTLNNAVDPSLSLNDGMALRRARLRFSGLMYEQVEFFAQYEFANSLDLRRRTLGIEPSGTPNTDFDPGDAVGFNEVYVGLVQVPVLGQVRVGRHRESLNFVTATADNNQVWLERGLLFDAFNGDYNFSNGVTMQNSYFADRAYTLLGFFQQNNTTNRAFANVGDGEYVYDARATCLPFWNEEEELWVHIGADYSYRNPSRERIRYRARPMIRTGSSFQVPSILNTGNIFTPDAQQIANLEFASAWGRWTFAAEAACSWVTNSFTGALPGPDGKLPADAEAHGTYFAEAAYVELMYFLTPDHRKYRKDRPGYDRVAPRENFYFIKGENGPVWSRGGWEVGARYDYVDLTNSGINGGTGQAVTFALNWYLNSNTRVQGNYFWMYRNFNPNDTEGRVNGDLQGLGIRFNCDF